MRGESGEENLDFSPVGVGQACFSLASKPPTAPQRAGFGLNPPALISSRAGKNQAPGDATGPFFRRRRKKIDWGDIFGARLEML